MLSVKREWNGGDEGVLMIRVDEVGKTEHANTGKQQSLLLHELDTAEEVACKEHQYGSE